MLARYTTKGDVEWVRCRPTLEWWEEDCDGGLGIGFAPFGCRPLPEGRTPVLLKSREYHFNICRCLYFDANPRTAADSEFRPAQTKTADRGADINTTSQSRAAGWHQLCEARSLPIGCSPKF